MIKGGFIDESKDALSQVIEDRLMGTDIAEWLILTLEVSGNKVGNQNNYIVLLF